MAAWSTRPTRRNGTRHKAACARALVLRGGRQETSFLDGLPGQSILFRPALHHRDLVGVGQAIGEAAALDDRAVIADLERHSAVEAAEWVFAGEGPDRDIPAHAK